MWGMGCYSLCKGIWNYKYYLLKIFTFQETYLGISMKIQWPTEHGLSGLHPNLWTKGSKDQHHCTIVSVPLQWGLKMIVCFFTLFFFLQFRWARPILGYNVYMYKVMGWITSTEELCLFHSLWISTAFESAFQTLFKKNLSEFNSN